MCVFSYHRTELIEGCFHKILAHWVFWYEEIQSSFDFSKKIIKRPAMDDPVAKVTEPVWKHSIGQYGPRINT